MKPIPLIKPKSWWSVGNLQEDDQGRVWIVKTRVRNWLKRPRAWCLDKEHYDLWLEHDGHGVRLELADNRIVESFRSDWERYSFPVNFDGPQVALTVDHWRQVDRRQAKFWEEE